MRGPRSSIRQYAGVLFLVIIRFSLAEKSCGVFAREKWRQRKRGAVGRLAPVNATRNVGRYLCPQKPYVLLLSEGIYSFLLWGEDADGSFPQRFGSIYWTNTKKLSDYGSTYYGNGKGGSGGPFNNGYLVLSESLIDGDIDAVVRTLKMNDGYAFWKNGTAKHYFNYSQASSNSSNPIPLGQWVNMGCRQDLCANLFAGSG